MAGKRVPKDGTAAPSFRQRFLQKLALSLIMINIIGPFFYWPLTLYVLYANPLSVTRSVMFAYLIFMFVLDKDTPSKPGGGTPIRRLKFWKHIADYFPARLIKTADISPEQNYIFCGHPHGIACFSYVANFFIEGTGFSDIFPGITLYPVLLDQHFSAPIHREVALMSGFRSNTKKSLMNILQGPPGCSVFLVPGGASEALGSQPGTYDLMLSKRKGFIRIAMQTGAHLVPIVAFGETDLFDVSQPKPGGLFHRLQQLVLRVTKFGLPVISGAGFWSGSGLLPKALPLTTVVGAPVKVTKWQGLTSDPAFAAAVDETHARYCEALRQLWNSHKDKYAPKRRKSMEFL